MEMEFILLDLLGIVVNSIKKCNKKTPQSKITTFWLVRHQGFEPWAP